MFLYVNEQFLLYVSQVFQSFHLVCHALFLIDKPACDYSKEFLQLRVL